MPDNNLRIRIEGDYFIPQIAGFLTTIDTIYNNIQFLSTKPDDYRDLLRAYPKRWYTVVCCMNENRHKIESPQGLHNPRWSVE